MLENSNLLVLIDVNYGGKIVKLINKDTGKVYRYYHRRPKNKDWSTRWLIGKKAETKGKLAVVPNI